ncbi:MAG: ribose-phosphate pyrophosphokinase [Clostridia bacterium]|nr:ribose-phosphate pyrophosphokinase [Clostridia bacterium]
MILFNGKSLTVKHFTNSECKVGELDSLLKDNGNVVEFFYETERKDYSVNEDLINLLFVASDLKRLNRNAKLVFWCMPYQRMDRKCEGDIFTLKPICEYINWMSFSEIFVVEPHSKQTLEMLNDAKAIDPLVEWIPEVKKKVGFGTDDYIVFPDKGAAERYSKYHFAPNICYFEKKRNNITNFIEKFDMLGEFSGIGKKCIIIDDLCSKGDTIFKCCERLVESGVEEIYVVVTHCEITALSNPIFAPTSKIKKFFTSKSNISVEHEKIEYLDVDLSRVLGEK